jgi:mono/diheme cytochrome c family protein
MRKRLQPATFLAAILFALACVSSGFAGAPAAAKKDASAVPVVQSSDADTMRIQGEQRFHANCGRCHAAPQKFPPRMMATVLRHMRVRATITSEDQRLILFYMTQ